MRQIDEGNAWQITFYRNFAFFISIGLVLTIIYGRQIFKSIIHIGKGGIIAGIFLAIANISFIHSLENTSVANTLFTLSTIPFITAIIAFFTIKERVSHLTFLLMAIAFLGIALMVSEGLRANEGIGIFLAFVKRVFICQMIQKHDFHGIFVGSRGSSLAGSFLEEFAQRPCTGRGH